METKSDVPEAARESGPQIVGRETELVALEAFLQADCATRALVLMGGAGIGKTTLWEAGIHAARGRGLRVLLARPSGAEARLAFAALIDLLDGVGTGELAELPRPQLSALEVAILRTEPADSPPEPSAIGVGFLNALRALASRDSLLIAVDDIQWLDPPSADALAFAARRLEGEAIQFLLAKRPATTSPLEPALERQGLELLEVGPLSLGATRRMLAVRLGLTIPRQLLRRLVDATLGNPLFALEVGRTLAERGLPSVGEDLPVPDTVEDLLDTRAARLPPRSRKLLLAVALSADLRSAELVRIADEAALDEVVDAGVLLLDGNRVRPSHPLLALAAKRRSRPAERRELHLELAGVVIDEELRALHLALATELPDEELARRVAEAAAGASARGARHEAAVLAQHALRLMPLSSPGRSECLLSLAGYLVMAGDLQGVADLLLPAVDSLPPGEARVRAYLLLVECDLRSEAEYESYLDLALAESGADPSLRSRVLPSMTIVGSFRLERIREAEAWAVEALTGAPLAGADVEREALHALAWVRGLQGLSVDDVCERFRAVSDTAVHISTAPERAAGQRHAWRGEIDRARAVHTRLQFIADERGEAISYAVEGLHLCELELRAGGWEEASRLLDEMADSYGELLGLPIYQRCRALLAAGRGLPDEAERWAAEVWRNATTSDGRWDRFEAQRAVGVAALLKHEPAQAVESLRGISEHMQREGVDEPGVFPVAPDLVEALVELGELDEAQAVTSRLRELAEAQEHPWGLVTAKRCSALIRLSASSYDEQAAVELVDAAAGYEALGLRFDRPRVLFSLGRVQRRLRKWGAARASLEDSASAFDEMGSTGWAEAARSELARVGARRPRAAGELTEAERRAVELAVEGLSNKEIASTLVVTVPTVEAHLSRAYAKLGVRSRGQLAGRLAADG